MVMNRLKLKAAILISTFLLLVACYEKTDAPLKNPRLASAEYMKSLQGKLHSQDWPIRYDALLALTSLSWQSRDLIQQALKDKSDVISKTAQAWFIQQGEQALDYLIQNLEQAGEDEGLYASIAGGVERNHMKSIAGTLWLTLVRGIQRDRCHEIMQTLVRHPSPRVRAVVLFTAASLRSEKYLDFLEILSKDNNSLLREKLRESLVHLLILDSYSTPELDEATMARCLALLKPELPAILNGETPARYVDADVTLGELLGREVLPCLRDRFIGLLEEVLPELSEKGAQRAGTIMEGQCWLEEDKDKYINSAWVTGKKRDKERLKTVFQHFIEKLSEKKEEKIKQNVLASLSRFPFEVYNEKFASVFFDSDFEDHLSASHVAIRFLLKSILENNLRLQEKALSLFEKKLALPDDRQFLEAAFAGLHGLTNLDGLGNSIENRENVSSLKSMMMNIRARLKDSLEAQVPRLFSLHQQLDLKKLCQLLDLCLRLEDKRSLQIFDRIWSQRRSEAPGAAFSIAQAVRLLAERKDKTIIPQLVEYVSQGSNMPNIGLKDLCIYIIRSHYFEFTKEFLTDEIFNKWLADIKDPEEHPRVRAAFATLLINPHLRPEQKKAVTDIFLGLTRPPHDWNLRSKSCWFLGLAGERRVLPMLYELALSRDAPYWVYNNIATGLYYLEARKANPAAIDVKAGARALVDLLETLLFIYEKPESDLKVIHVNNYFAWGVQYWAYPPFFVWERLKAYTEKDFGYDIARWKTWLKDGN